MADGRSNGIDGNLLSHRARRNWRTVVPAVQQALTAAGLTARADIAASAALTHLVEKFEPEAFLRSFRAALGGPVRPAAPATTLPQAQHTRRNP